ncbi:MAG TPA: dihydroorotase [Lactobacillaceae bacterium]|jgi:dihydroorotase
MLIIQNAKILDTANALRKVDVLIAGDKIMRIEPHIDVVDGTQTFDANGAFLTAGLVDVHVHFREPGFEYKETVASGSAAAARGGFTTVVAMPNLNPVPDNIAALKTVLDKNKSDGLVHIEQYGAISADLTADKINDIQALSKAGAKAFTNDGHGVQHADTMYQAMQAVAQTGKVLSAHLEDESLLHSGVMNAGEAAAKIGLPGITGLAESSQLARDLVLAEATGVKYHVAHISTAQSVELVRAAKARGVQVTAEVSPHHLLLSDADIPGDNALFKMNPPLRSEVDRAAVLAGLLDGTIDMIATDHAPHGLEEKAKSMIDAPFGITGIETSFQLLYTHLVKSGVMSLATLIERMVVAPIDVFDLRAPRTLAVGEKADLALFDLADAHTIKFDEFASKGKNTPFVGWEVYGTTVATFVDGVKVYERA